jgi:uncharacterized Ntn-hydrolase superfamily protein
MKSLLCCLLATVTLWCGPAAAGNDPLLRPVNTYSIVARDPSTGELGVAVQSHWFSVGSIVSWAEPGVGAVATQSFVDPDYGPLGLQLMRAGKTANEALTALVSADEHADVRQVAMVDAQGRVANFTGDKAIDEHCDATGAGFAVQANLMWKPTVCEAMVKAFASAGGDLAERLMRALEAAEAEGGDVRGKQSAAMLIVSGDRDQSPWRGRVIDLRVEDHPEPLRELRRLVTVNKAYNLMNRGDEQMMLGEVEQAVESYGSAEAMVPESHEMVFWHAATLANAGRVDEALPLFARAFEAWPKWRELVPRLPAAGLLPDDPELLARILAAE